MEIIRFEGTWVERDKEIVREVVRRTEAALNLEVPTSLMGKRWTCRCDVDDDQTVYIASRVNLEVAISANTITQLLKQLLQLVGDRRRTYPPERYVAPSTHVFPNTEWPHEGKA